MNYFKYFLNYLKNVKQRLVNYITESELTVCHELERQAHITKEELQLDLEYCKLYVSDRIVIVYKILIFPVVWSMKKSVRVTKWVCKVAKRVWLNKVWEHMKGNNNE